MTRTSRRRQLRFCVPGDSTPFTRVEIGLRSAPDEGNLRRAVSDDRVCITLDRDLHQLLAESGVTVPSVILLRHVQLTPLEIGSLIHSVVNQIGGQLAAGVAATVTPRSIRVKRLPLRMS